MNKSTNNHQILYHVDGGRQLKERQCCDRYDEMMKDRAAGMTYEQIGKKHGVSRQRVGQMIGRSNKYCFRVIKKDGCKFINLRNWMNENSISRNELVRMMGFIPNGETMARIRAYLSGLSNPPKTYIDRMIEATGMDYETLFEIG